MQGGRLVLLFLALHVRWSASQITGGCRKIDDCSCESDQGVVDLSPLASNGDPTFKNLTNPDLTGWLYAWNPCNAFTFGNCVNVSACEYSQDESRYSALGTQNSSTFSIDPDSGQIQVMYTDTTHGDFRGLQIMLICDLAQEKDVFVQPPDGSPIAAFTLTSRYCCPQRHSSSLSSLSIGDFIVIGFAGLVLMYILVGVVFQVGVRKATGKNILPNYDFWSSLPGLIKDGILFTFTCGRSTYANF